MTGALFELSAAQLMSGLVVRGDHTLRYTTILPIRGYTYVYVFWCSILSIRICNTYHVREQRKILK